MSKKVAMIEIEKGLYKRATPLVVPDWAIIEAGVRLGIPREKIELPEEPFVIGIGEKEEEK